MAELKSCPFCGNKATTYQTLAEMWACGCDLKTNHKQKCGIVCVRANKEEAIKGWNRRAESESAK
ncbi:hypothetical protein SDC9_80122 [bioreactor metagenome]|uniref:Restriction alleviation protein, Lar family n=1 Tax=bioreactor metagenome TaxID=1076179 RepID=A0A644YYC6_9ZZZZ